MSSGAITTNNVRLIKQTDKALLVNIKGAEVWVPFSKSHYSAITQQLSLPKWLYESTMLEVDEILKKKGSENDKPLDAIADMQDSISNVLDTVSNLFSLEDRPPVIGKGLAATMDNYVTEWIKLHPTENLDDYCIMHKRCRDGSVAHWIEKKGSRE